MAPYSIQTALAMTFAGSEGETRVEMAKVLHYRGDEAMHGSFAALRHTLGSVVERSAAIARNAKQQGGPSEPIVLNVANRLYGQQGYVMKQPFLDLLAREYGAPFEALDFGKDPENSRKHINNWVEEQTRQRIRDLIPPLVLGAGTRLVLVNALYLKAPWAEEFRETQTQPKPFHIDGGAGVDVPTMKAQKYYGYARREGYTAVSLPYSGGGLHFLVLIPDAVEGLAALEQKLSAEDLEACATLPRQEVLLELPKFKIEPPGIAVAAELEALGMRSAFDRPAGSANFNRMTPRQPADYLYISEVIHKTFLVVDEKGTEAAAATAVLMRAGSAAAPAQPVEVKVDRPFLFAIQHGSSGACLFLGRVVDPR